ncbi:MAG: ABC transporter substrate-binding protein [Sulfobacillus acidophilus]|uniref:ABC transporter substrate-binding protein n=1 Tax=Sulfobacillus acidophilus TaxID=53633 RepID=A0A2T2WN26_9FIRM|nr:MAG: ABC transporter substrate-binding protein [Sulfobacillus acidophilus]
MLKRSIAFVGASSLALLSASGWAASGVTVASRSAGTDTIVMATAALQAPNWFFPIMSDTGDTLQNAQLQGLMYKPLIFVTSQDTVDYARSVASKITVNKASTQFTITLGNKYKWSNGQPITAQDVVFTWDVIKAASEKHTPWAYANVGTGGVPTAWKSVVATGAKTVVVTTTHPYNRLRFIIDGLGQLTPMPMSVWDKYPKNMDKELQFMASVANSPSNPVYHVVDGPYKFLKMVPNDYWEFVPNPAYGGHQSHIKAFVLQYETSTAAEFEALKEGTVNVGYLPNSSWDARNQLTNDVVHPIYFLGFTYMPINMNRHAPNGLGPVFRQLYIRQALQMGVNEPGMIKDIFHGEATQSYGPVASLPQSQFASPATATAAYPFNPARGKKLLEAHGWKDVRGVMTKGKLRLAFMVTYISGSPTITDQMELLKSDWAQEGIDATLRPEPLVDVDMNQTIDPTQWSIEGPYNWTWGPFFPSGEQLFGTGGGSNNGGYSNATTNAILAAGAKPLNAAKTLADLYAYEKNVRQQNPVLFLPWPAGSYSVQGDYLTYAKNVQGVVSTASSSGLIYPNYWTVSG